jgi:hypothetical protein
MTQSFTVTAAGALATIHQQERRRILVTGAAGRIGSYFAEHAPHHYELRLMVQEQDAQAVALQQFGDVVIGDLGDLERMKELCQNIDTVLHLAADPDPSATWSSLLPANIIGTYHTFAAAKAAGCRRVLYASSIHAVSGYPADVQVKTSEPVNPGDLYGVTKCFGEALGRYMAEQEGLSVIALRIGAWQPLDVAREDDAVRLLDAFVSQRDLQQLIERCIAAEHITFAIMHGVSNNRFKRLDISDARALVGYDPQDDLTAEHPALKELHLTDTVSTHQLRDGDQQSGLREEL